jgi:hypothetical protein
LGGVPDITPGRAYLYRTTLVTTWLLIHRKVMLSQSCLGRTSGVYAISVLVRSTNDCVCAAMRNSLLLYRVLSAWRDKEKVDGLIIDLDVVGDRHVDERCVSWRPGICCERRSSWRGSFGQGCRLGSVSDGHHHCRRGDDRLLVLLKM